MTALSSQPLKRITVSQGATVVAGSLNSGLAVGL